ncbi:MAG: hypothetical protein IJM69_06595, partial [Firmicutes bacterium]|nr:hypothetical protein [Bacillota bacterium]
KPGNGLVIPLPVPDEGPSVFYLTARGKFGITLVGMASVSPTLDTLLTTAGLSGVILAFSRA